MEVRVDERRRDEASGDVDFFRALDLQGRAQRGDAAVADSDVDVAAPVGQGGGGAGSGPWSSAVLWKEPRS